ncbi:MAG TPA: ABC transporter substrate-binding protein, partial [Microlunatus sp.]|nr:ABC transporter substrate-binding protein [Microlunatus sp.]
MTRSRPLSPSKGRSLSSGSRVPSLSKGLGWSKGVSMIAGLLLALVAGCAGPGAAAQPGGDTPRPGGTLRFSISGDPLCLDGHAISSGLNQFLGRIAYDTVTTLDRDGNPAPYLAESWEVGDAGRTYTFKLRAGVTFSDGEPWNAEAFKINLEHMRDP